MDSRSAGLLSTLTMLAACGSGNSPLGVPEEAPALESKLKTGMASFVPRTAGFEASLIGMLNPGTPLAQGVTSTPDGSAGAPPFASLFAGSYDGNGDGSNESRLSGRVTFASDPDVAWTGMQGQSVIDVDILGLIHVYHGDLDFAIDADARRLSGSGTFTEPLTGATTTLAADPGSPLAIRPATGAANAVSNACGYSLDGRLELTVANSSGTLSSNWNFARDSAQAAVTGATFVDRAGKSHLLPDSNAEIACDSGGRIDDWAGTFEMDWACLPRESGRSRLVATVLGPDTISIEDEDPPGSGDVRTYQATVIGAGPHVLRGFFIGGPVGSRYREDFNWTLASNGRSFSQVSSYAYQEGPLTGSGGPCVGRARRP